MPSLICPAGRFGIEVAGNVEKGNGRAPGEFLEIELGGNPDGLCKI
jgi:hypothetical protein